MSDDELVEFSQRYIEERGVKSRYGLQTTDLGLYSILRRRKVLGRVIPNSIQPRKKRKKRKWSSMSDEEIVTHAQEFLKESGICSEKDLRDADPGLHSVLAKRILLDKVGFEEKRRPRRAWKSMNDEEIIGYAQELMRKRGISGRKELYDKDCGLYDALRIRNLLEKTGFQMKRKQRNWKSLNDDEIVELAQTYLGEKGLSSRSDLQKADAGLYYILSKRKLLDRVRFGKKRRNWAAMSDDELVTYAQEFLKEKGITGRAELRGADSRLHYALRKRNLLDRIFLPIEQARDSDQKKQAVQDVVDAMEEF